MQLPGIWTPFTFWHLPSTMLKWTVCQSQVEYLLEKCMPSPKAQGMFTHHISSWSDLFTLPPLSPSGLLNSRKCVAIAQLCQNVGTHVFSKLRKQLGRRGVNGSYGFYCRIFKLAVTWSLQLQSGLVQLLTAALQQKRITATQCANFLFHLPFGNSWVYCHPVPIIQLILSLCCQS